jgi:hypothetical protein
MSEEDFKAMLDKYYDGSIDNLRLRGLSRKKRPFISEGCGKPPDPAHPASKATLQRCRGQWPSPRMLDQNGTLCLVDGEYMALPSFEPSPHHVPSPTPPSQTFIMHTSTVYTNVQVVNIHIFPFTLTMYPYKCVRMN